MLKKLFHRKRISPQEELALKQEMERAVFALQARVECLLRQQIENASHKLAA